MGRRSKKEQIEKKGDRNFKDIKRQINKRNKRMQDEDIIEEMWVTIIIQFFIGFEGKTYLDM